MISKGCQRHYSFLQPPKFTDSLKNSTTGTLSPDTITTTSSGYSTGGSSVSTTIVPSLIEHNQQKTKNKGIHNFITKLKNLIISPKPKLVHSNTTRDMSSTAILRQSLASNDLPSSSSMTTSNTISLPFTYYHNSPRKSEYNNKQNNESYVTKATNYEKISAWLNHTEILTPDEQDNNNNNLQFIDEIPQQSIPSSPSEIDYQINMKKTPLTTRTPKRSTSMVSTMTRPIIEQRHYERTLDSPTASFASSILTKGMSERMTPQTSYHQSRTNLTEDQINILLPKSNRRRAIDFSRRKTVAGITEPINNNKENIPVNRRQQIYQFSPSTSKKYYFHSNAPVKNEDILMNSYGLTLLQQQQQPIQQRQTVSALIMMSQVPELRSVQKQPNHRSSIHLIQQPLQQCTSDSLDDLLCDREVESYFYPNKQQSPVSFPQHVYMNLETPPKNYYRPPPYIHGTLC